LGFEKSDKVFYRLYLVKEPYRLIIMIMEIKGIEENRKRRARERVNPKLGFPASREAPLSVSHCPPIKTE